MGIFTRKVETEIDRTFKFYFSKYGILWILKLWSVNIIAWLRFTSVLLISKYLSYKIYTLNSYHVKLESYDLYLLLIHKFKRLSYKIYKILLMKWNTI